jgi:hypothetical protein
VWEVLHVESLCWVVVCSRSSGQRTLEDRGVRMEGNHRMPSICEAPLQKKFIIGFYSKVNVFGENHLNLDFVH